jgi:hypothetical protein
MNNLWILTEERPKKEVIRTILNKVASDHNFKITSENLRVIPIIKNDRFTFVYKTEGIKCDGFDNVFIKIASGDSSFVDFLIFLQENEPVQTDTPIYAIEETKTDDSESRNTGVYQRCSKFVYVEFYYPNIKKIMLYNLQVPQKKKPTSTNIFGTRMLRTINVEIMGKVFDEEIMKPFANLEEFAEAKNSMRMPPKGNVPIKIKIYSDKITISGRLYKKGGIGHDPNIGALTIMSLCIRVWEKIKDIVIVEHGLKQEHLGKNNKFIQIADRLRIKLAGLKIPVPNYHNDYWHYDNLGEKNATIFLHVSILAYTTAKVIYENHAGCERGYYEHPKSGAVAIEKYQKDKRALYKDGDKTAIIYIPDMIVFDDKRSEIIDVEGKKFSTRKDGINELANYSYIDKVLNKPAYKPKSIIRTVAIFGSKNTSIPEKEIGFLLNEEGEMILGKNAPEIFKEVKIKLLAV